MTRMKKARGDGKGSERISRDMLQTKTLSLKARGLLALLKSLPDDWDCGGAKGISQVFCDKDGPHAVNEAIKELEEHGLFARLKHQVAGGKWDWLWTFADYPDELDAEVRRWEAKGFRVAERGGNPEPKTPPSKTGSMLGKLEHGAMTEKPVDGESVDGEPPNKDSSLPPSEEGTTEQDQITHASRAAEPPCVVVEFDADRTSESLGSQVARIEQKRAKAARSPAALNETAHSPSSRVIVEAFVKTFQVRPTPKVFAQWCASVSELQKLDYPELLIKKAMVACRDAGKPPAALASFASALAGQANAAPKSRTTAKFEAEMRDGMNRYGLDPVEAWKLMYPNSDLAASEPPQLAEEAS